MLATDFEYDGINLSDFGFTTCLFGDSGEEDISIGSVITFNTVQRHFGKEYGLTSTEYGETISTSFGICRDPDVYDDMRIAEDEKHSLVRWLNRREFLPLKFIYTDEDNLDIYYNASFNIDKYLVDDILYGFTLTMVTDKPFGYGEEISQTIEVTDTASTYTITDESYEIGHTYPDMQITCNADGDLYIINETESCEMLIQNCTAGEVITITGDTHIISSSVSGHALYTDFNWDFFKIGNTYDNRENEITVSLLCTIVLTYRPIIKDSPN